MRSEDKAESTLKSNVVLATERSTKKSHGSSFFNEQLTRRTYESKVQEVANSKKRKEQKFKECLERAEREKFKDIFKALDSDNDGQISSDKVDINSKV
jgi:hypothetical protein